MDDLDNGMERGVYWTIFLIVVLVIGIGGYILTFGLKRDTKGKKKTDTDITEGVDLNVYKGVWYLTNDHDDVDREFIIHHVDGDTVVFDYLIKDGPHFLSESIILADDVGSYDMNSEDDEVNLKGTVTLKKNKVYFAISASNSEIITTEMLIFSEKKENSILK